MSDRNVTPGNFSLRGKIKPGHIWTALIILVVIIALLTGIFIVDQTEDAVVTRFGRLHRTVGPGLSYKVPLGIEKAFKIPTKVVQTMQFGFRTDQPGVTTVYSQADFSQESEMLTGDLNIVDVTWIIQYRISDPVAWLFNVDDTQVSRTEDNRQKTIRDISQSVVNQLVGDRAILDVIGSERTAIEVEAAEMIQTVLNKYEIGINLTTVKLQNIVPPKGEVQDAFEDVNKAIQDMNRFINEGKEAYNAEIPKARGQADQRIQVAEGYKTERINNAVGDTARFRAIYAEYLRNPGVTRDRLYYEAIEDIFSTGEAFDLVDKNLENFLPLKQVGAGGGQ